MLLSKAASKIEEAGKQLASTLGLLNLNDQQQQAAANDKKEEHDPADVNLNDSQHNADQLQKGGTYGNEADLPDDIIDEQIDRSTFSIAHPKEAKGLGQLLTNLIHTENKI